MGQMIITYTPTKPVAYVSFSASGTYDINVPSPGQFVIFQLMVNGVAQNGRGCAAIVGEYSPTGYANPWSGSFFVPISTTVGVSTTVLIQWNYQSLVNNTIYNWPSQTNANRSLIIME